MQYVPLRTAEYVWILDQKREYDDKRFMSIVLF